jgi:hypothetical protein
MGGVRGLSKKCSWGGSILRAVALRSEAWRGTDFVTERMAETVIENRRLERNFFSI